MKAKVKAYNEIVDVYWHDSRECWYDRKNGLYFDGYQLEFIEEEKAIDWEQRRWELCKEVFIKDRYEYSSPEKAAIEIVKDVTLLIKELKSNH